MSTPSRFRVSICKGPDCRARGGDAVLRRARELVAERGLSDRCELIRGGCYGLCETGPTVVVRPAAGPQGPDRLAAVDYQLLGTPGETHYPAMDPVKLTRVFDEHVADGRPVEALLARRSW